MLDTIRNKFRSVIQSIGVKQHISEKNIRDAVEDIKTSLLDADVNLRVVRRFVNHTIEHATGEQVLKSVKPGEQFTKIIYDKMVEMLGVSSSDIRLKSKDQLSCILLAGLQGSGKTSTAAKLSRKLQAQNYKVLLVSLDYSRPAAVEQLRQLSTRYELDFYETKDSTILKDRAHDALQYAKKNKYSALIVDTAGRMQASEDAMLEIQLLGSIFQPIEVLFIADAMTGQAAAETAKAFNSYIPLSGVILSKFDSDTRGGAALSVVSVTGCPIKLIGTGEHIENLEQFYPDRIASRILGMGDVVSLVEKAQSTIDEKEAEKLQKKINKAQFTLDDYLKQFDLISKMGSLQNIQEMIPGIPAVDPTAAEGKLKKERALIQSMTLEERRNHRIIGLSRRRRIALGSGSSIFDINNFLKRFEKMRVMMKRMSKNKTMPI